MPLSQPSFLAQQALATHLPAYAELHCLTNFSFLRGASHPYELVEQAMSRGYSALAITDECSLAGVVRAHTALKDSWARRLARELGVELVAGSVLERLPGEEKLANTSVHIDAAGELRASYRKLHMFDVEVGGRRYQESELELPGDEIVLSHTASGAGLGLTVCYDLRFPELYRILAVRGAQLIALPSAFTLATTRDHWEVLVRARAIENQVFMIAANQFGAHPANQHSGGRSMIVDPWGLVLAQAPDGEGHILAEADLERQRQIRASLPSLANRREEAYRWPQEQPA